MSFLYLEADKFLIGRLIGAGELGYYSNSKQLVKMIVTVVRRPVETVAMPLLSTLQSDQQKMAETICKSQRMMATLLIPIFCGLGALAPEAIGVIFGPKWTLAIEPLRYLSFAEAVNACSAVAFTAIMAVGRPGLGLIHLGVCAVTSIIGTLVGAQWGIVGVSIAALLNAFVYSTLFLVILCKATQVTALRYLGSNMPALIAGTIMIAVTLTITKAIGENDGNLFIRATAGVLSGAASYILALRLVSPDSFKTALSIGTKTLGLKWPN